MHHFSYTPWFQNGTAFALHCQLCVPLVRCEVSACDVQACTCLKIGPNICGGVELSSTFSTLTSKQGCGKDQMLLRAVLRLGVGVCLPVAVMSCF